MARRRSSRRTAPSEMMLHRTSSSPVSWSFGRSALSRATSQQVTNGAMLRSRSAVTDALLSRL
jgi:hypothetical protein